MNVAILGVGLMGFPMGQRLCQAGFQVSAFNRTPEKAQRLSPFGATVAASAAEAVASADVVITMLEHGGAVEQVIFGSGAAQAMRPGTLVIDMSSIKPGEARDHAQRLAQLGINHLDAPVSGGTVGAEQGSLAIMVGGRGEDYARALPLFSAMGRPTHVGPAGAGQLAKLANQMIVGITIGAISEALLLAAKGGADMASVRKAIRGGFAESRVLEVHGQRIVDGDFAKRAAVAIQRKDFENALETARNLGLDLPVTSLLTALNSDAMAHGFGDLDHSALYLELERRNQKP